LPAAFEVDFQFLSLFLCLPGVANEREDGFAHSGIQVKGGRQECLPHTHRIPFARQSLLE
jgi:hypothetical protein